MVLPQFYHKIGLKIRIFTRKSYQNQNFGKVKTITTTTTQFFQKLPPQPLPQPQFLDFHHHNPNPYHNFWKVNTPSTTTTQCLGKNGPKLWFSTIVPQFYAHPDSHKPNITFLPHPAPDYLFQENSQEKFHNDLLDRP